MISTVMLIKHEALNSTACGISSDFFRQGSAPDEGSGAAGWRQCGVSNTSRGCEFAFRVCRDSKFRRNPPGGHSRSGTKTMRCKKRQTWRNTNSPNPVHNQHLSNHGIHSSMRRENLQWFWHTMSQRGIKFCQTLSAGMQSATVRQLQLFPSTVA